ncbi:MAG: glycosyl transferase family 4 [Nanoarchaeota archaeon]|nr:glycosyl transferase family 4 [Nanoarchaeota archaeon]MBU0977104.1 glycosyl transferase family 4 [Nanoarchaeota archaeon]
MNLLLIVPILASFFVTLFVMRGWIKKAKNAGLVGQDINKLNGKKVAESGGVTVVLGFALGIMTYVAINTFIFRSVNHFVEIFALMTTTFFIAFLAFTDDMHYKIGWKMGLRRRTRIILVAFASIPLIAINAGRSIVGIPFFGGVDLGIIYPLVLIPVGIVGATTTYNFLAGFNGLEAGQGVILLSALAIVSYLTGNSWLSIIAICMVVALVAFLVYNFYPAQVFPGDVLTYPVGGLIAMMAILGNFEKIAVFFFIPFIIEFFLKARGKFIMQSYGKPQKDGSLTLKYGKIYSLNHVAIALMGKVKIKATERKVVLFIWLFQILVILIGFALFWGGLYPYA